MSEFKVGDVVKHRITDIPQAMVITWERWREAHPMGRMPPHDNGVPVIFLHAGSVFKRGEVSWDEAGSQTKVEIPDWLTDDLLWDNYQSTETMERRIKELLKGDELLPFLDAKGHRITTPEIAIAAMRRCLLRYDLSKGRFGGPLDVATAEPATPRTEKEFFFSEPVYPDVKGIQDPEPEGTCRTIADQKGMAYYEPDAELWLGRREFAAFLRTPQFVRPGQYRERNRG